MKRIALLGSTGSIGTNTLNVARHLKEEIEVVALAAGSNVDLLVSQAEEFHPQVVAIADTTKTKELQERLPNILVTNDLNDVATAADADMVISAIAGTKGLAPTVAAIKSGKAVGLANKEALVSGGALVMALAEKHQVPIIPIDSEHSAIFQCLNGEARQEVSRLILTSSGGPFRTFSEDALASITVEKALCHPTWSMGKKVTIDSSTLMNKGLEVIEAYWLFNLPSEKIDVVIHPQSVIHSMVEFVDHSILAQMGEPTMITPIQYAITYPHRKPSLLPPFDFTKARELNFADPDKKRFRCLDLAYESLRIGGSLSCFMNGANEVLVQRFLQKEISWLEIGQKLEILMEHHSSHPLTSIEEVLLIDEEARQLAQIS